MANGEGVDPRELRELIETVRQLRDGVQQLMDLTASCAAVISMVVEFYPMDRRAKNTLLDVLGSLTAVAGQDAVQEAVLAAEINSWGIK